jgi:hypothetical protein
MAFPGRMRKKPLNAALQLYFSLYSQIRLVTEPQTNPACFCGEFEGSEKLSVHDARVSTVNP